MNIHENRATRARQIVAALLLMAVSTTQAAAAPSARIGYVWSGAPGSDPVETEALRRGLRELGYIEGRNLVIEYRYAEGNPDRLPGLIAELIDLKVAVIVTPGTPVTAVARREGRGTPIVSVSNDPVSSGFVQTLARPGGTITGLSLTSDTAFTAKWLELVKETLPRTSRVGLIWNPTNRSNAAAQTEMDRLAPRFGVQLSSHAAQRPPEIEAAFASMSKARMAAVIFPNDPFLTAQRDRIVRLAAASRIPVFAGLGYFAEGGALMSYGPSLYDVWRRAAYFVDKIITGTKPADLPVEQPTTFELIVNMRTAKALGMTVPPSLLGRADKARPDHSAVGPAEGHQRDPVGTERG
jgi:putative ABC transport system substrate-binding protein